MSGRHQPTEGADSPGQFWVCPECGTATTLPITHEGRQHALGCSWLRGLAASPERRLSALAAPYVYLPTEAATSLVHGSSEHHTEGCNRARRTAGSEAMDLTVCYCDLPGHVKAIQTEAREYLALALGRMALAQYPGTVVQAAVLKMLDDAGFEVAAHINAEREQER